MEGLKDRFALDFPTGYEVDFLGKNVMIVARNGSPLYILNAQNVRTNDNGRQVGYNVLGTNQIPNHRGLEETVF